MATIDTHRASYTRPNPNLKCGVKPSLPSPTVIERVTHFFTVKYGNTSKIVSTIAQVNAILAIHPNASVVRTTKTTTVETRHKRIR